MGDGHVAAQPRMKSAPVPLQSLRWVILGLLLGIAAVAWGVLGTWGMGADAMMGSALGIAPARFLIVWLVMMVAMMFPTAAPMVLMFASVQAARQRRGQVVVSTWVFVAGYLIVWTAFGFPVYGLAALLEQFLHRDLFSAESSARAGGALIVLAGLYQLSPFKRVCLTHCRSPLHFVLAHWREGAIGALVMGVRHGMYCLGCCWLLFLILLPLGSMNIGAMVLITALIFAEKTLPFGRAVRLAAAALLVGYGGLVLLDPHLLPTARGMM